MTETKKPMPWLPWFPGDFLSSSRVQRMTLAEQGAYRRLLDFQWMDGSIPSDLGEIARLLGVSELDAGVIWKRIGTCFERDGDTYRNQRLHAERERAWLRHRQLSESGKAGAAKTWAGHGKANGVAIGVAKSRPMASTTTTTTTEEQRPTCARPRTREAAPRGPANKPVTGRQRTDVRAFLAHFASRYAAVVGTPYVPQGADGKQAAAILDALPDHADIKARLERFLTSDDPFIAQAARTVATFRACLNKPCILATAPEPVKSPEALWAVASACLSKFGSNRFQEAYDAAGEPVASIVRKAGGWKALGAATEFDARRLFLASVNGHAKA